MDVEPDKAALTRLPSHVRLARLGYALLASVFVACVAAQVFLAGLGVFAGPEYWVRHTGFVHLFGWLPLLMVPLAFVGRLPRGLRFLPAGLLGLIAMQYATANSYETVVAALHPVGALAIFLVAIIVARRAWRNVAFLKNRKPGG
jgi:hypothetical protein